MHRYIVRGNEWLTPSTILLTLQRKPESHKAFGYIPGQYAAIAFTNGGRPSYARCFSITSSPTDIDTLQFSIRVQGRFTSRLSQIEPGNDIAVRGPYGGFVVDATKHTDVVFVAGGIGIAPFMSMLRHMSATNYPYKISLLYGVHDQGDIAFVDELRTLERTMPNLRIVYAVSQGNIDTLAGQQVVQGRLDEATFQAVIPGGAFEKTVFICGPPTFMNGMVKLAQGQGVAADRIITEAFNQGDHRQTGKVLSWPRNMYVLGSLGVAAGAFAIMVSDIIKNLPATPLTTDTEARTPLRSSSNRENDLEALIRKLLPSLGDDREDSPSTTQALNDANTPSTSTTATSSSTQTQTTVTPSTSTTTSVSTPTATTPTPVTPTPTPVVTPAPVCTTSASGVTTCR